MRPHRLVRPILVLTVSAVAATAGHAQQLYDFGDAFGRAVDVAGGTVLVAEPLSVVRPGTVHLFERDADGGWTRRASLTASDAMRGDEFGRAADAAPDRLIVGAPAAGRAGAAYLFERVAGEWREVARLEHEAAPDGYRFGASVAVSRDVALVGAEAAGDGAVHVYRRDAAGAWAEVSRYLPGTGRTYMGAALALDGGRAAVCAADPDGTAVVEIHRVGDEMRPETILPTGRLLAQAGGLLRTDVQLSCDVELAGDRALVGLPAAEQGDGAVLVFRRADRGAWVEEAVISPAMPEPGTGFGTDIALDGDGGIWVGAPGADDDIGRVYRYARSGAGWVLDRTVTGGTEDFVPAFGLALAAEGGVAVVGSPGASYGAGAARVYARTGAGTWALAAELAGDGERYERVTGGEVECEEGKASVFDCRDIDLVSFLPVQELGADRGVFVNDLWGWTDPGTGREYALVGRVDGTAFVDVSDAENPVFVGELPKTPGSRGNAWRDIKVYRDHAFVVADAAGEHGMQVFDLTRLRDYDGGVMTFEADTVYRGIHSAHNIIINTETGFAYTVGNSSGGETCGGAYHMIDIREPEAPTFAGCYGVAGTGRNGQGATHDAQCVVYRGPDARYRDREICFGSSETALSIADVTDKENPVPVASAAYPNVAYAHQGWLSEDHRYFFMNDEADELSGVVDRTRTLIWDVAELDDPVLVREYFGPTATTDHNLYVRGNLLYESNYAEGLRIIDISDPENPREVGSFDTAPFTDVGFMDGSWSNYPFFESGIIIVTSHKQGLFVLKRSAPIS